MARICNYEGNLLVDLCAKYSHRPCGFNLAYPIHDKRDPQNEANHESYGRCGATDKTRLGLTSLLSFTTKNYPATQT